MLHSRFSTRATVVAAAVALVAGVVPCAAVAKKKSQPHLVLESAKVHASRYAFHGDGADFSLKYVVKNTGNAEAPKTRTVLLLSRPRVGGFVVVSTLTPHLGPGKSFRGVGHHVFDVSASTALGAYSLRVCPDFLDVLPGPQPRCVKKGRFYIAEKEWVGEIHGVGPVAGAALGEHWDSLPAQLDFSRYLGHGAFHYDFTGTVVWQDHGINSGGCLWQGTGSLAVDQNNAGPGIVLDYEKGSYKGKETLHDRFFTITASGGGGFPCHSTQPGPVQKTFLNIPKRALRFDHKALKGTFGSAAAEDTQWKWSFH